MKYKVFYRDASYRLKVGDEIEWGYDSLMDGFVCNCDRYRFNGFDSSGKVDLTSIGVYDQRLSFNLDSYSHGQTIGTQTCFKFYRPIQKKLCILITKS